MKSLKALLICCLSAILLGGLFYFWSLKSYPSLSESRIRVLEELETKGIADLEFEDISGQKFKIAEFQGKLVIVNYWASWCTPCLEEFPSMLKLLNEFKGRLIVVAVSQDSSKEDIQAFLKSFPEANQNDFKIVWDKDRASALKFNIDRLPESLLLDGNSRLVKKIVGSINWYSPESIEYLNSILK